MEHAGVSVEAGPQDQSDHGFQVDIESNVDFNTFDTEGLDFGYDGSHEAELEISGETFEAGDLEFGNEVDGDNGEHLNLDLGTLDHIPDAANDERGHGGIDDQEEIKNADLEDVADHDEIGYEDDELRVDNVDAGLGTSENPEPEAALTDTLAGNLDEPALLVYEGEAEEPLAGEDVPLDQDINFGEHEDEDREQHDQDYNKEEVDEHYGEQSEEYQEEHHEEHHEEHQEEHHGEDHEQDHEQDHEEHHEEHPEEYNGQYDAEHSHEQPQDEQYDELHDEDHYQEHGEDHDHENVERYEDGEGLGEGSHGENTKSRSASVSHDGQEAVDFEDAAVSTAVDDSDGASHEHVTPSQHGMDLDKELDDLAESVSEFPDVEVLYNQTSYSLFGSSGDDPQSYFLSDASELDRPLSQFLSALRTVISEEMAPADELIVRFEPLDFEFGERSNEKFLRRTFREILGCHSTLGQVPGVPSEPVIHLIVRRDSEEHFLEILEEAEQVRASPASDSEDSEMSDGEEEEFHIDAFGGDQVHNEAPEGEDRGSDDDGHHAPTHLEEEITHTEPESVGDEENVAPEEEPRFQFESTASQSADDADGPAEGTGHFDETHVEESSDFVEHREGEGLTWNEEQGYHDESGTAHPEITLDVADEHAHGETEEQQGSDSPKTTEAPASNEAAIADDTGAEPETATNGNYPSFLTSTPQLLLRDPQIAIGTQTPKSMGKDQDDGSWEIDYSDDEFESAHRSMGAKEERKPVSGLFLRGSISQKHSSILRWMVPDAVESPPTRGAFKLGNSDTDADNDAYKDDELVLAFDDEPALSTIGEDTGDHNDDLTASAENLPDDANSLQNLEAAEDDHESTSKHSEADPDAAAGAETASTRTSMTMNGDEIDYEDEEIADDALTSANDDAQQSVGASSVQHDEIDWENDEDEDGEEQVTNGDSGVEYEEPKEATSASPGHGGKRSRTDEAESLVDETDHKRRRT
ncbi:hypothetical protein B0J18DRAFT_184905 [Chaetomium sp. MPI-SDFR-AT-0129]|nr:hypothetical protein B0J18DRAFT_184905 [Chaetomium sp. MPI-SDFR-AT-0129]